MCMSDEVVFDLDQVRAAKMEAEPIEYRVLKLYDREWSVRMAPPVFSLMEFADTGGATGQVKFLLSYIKSDEREDFHRALASDEYLDAGMLETLLNFMTEGSTGRPTEPSSSSEPSSSPIGENSTDDSSSQEVLADSPT